MLTETKNGSARTVPLTRAALEVFKEALNHPTRPKDCDLIFFGEPGRDGKRRPYEFHPAWQQILIDNEITGLRFHDLRHEAVSRLVEAGLGDQEVAAISGHKSMQMLQRYTHLRAEDLIEKLDICCAAPTTEGVGWAAQQVSRSNDFGHFCHHRRHVRFTVTTKSEFP